MLSLYPDIEPFSHYHLTIGSDNSAEQITDEKSVVKHKIYVEQCGNPSGIPVVFLHGGPGSGCRPSHRCFFDPKRYHIILFDQRGCGRSEPCGSLTENTTTHIIQDMEVIRKHIGIDKWLVFGGSWGATLGLYYAKHFPERVLGLILRGVFLARQQDIDWVYSNKGAAKVFPDAWDNLVNALPLLQQHMPLPTLYQQLTNKNASISNATFNKIQHWEASLVYWQSLLSVDETSKEINAIKEDDKAASIIQLYYSMNQCFIGQEPLLENLASIEHIPTKIIHGRHDMVCPVEQAWLLKTHFPKAELSIIEMAGHVANEPKIINALIKATNDFAQRN